MCLNNFMVMIYLPINNHSQSSLKITLKTQPIARSPHPQGYEGIVIMKFPRLHKLRFLEGWSTFTVDIRRSISHFLQNNLRVHCNDQSASAIEGSVVIAARITQNTMREECFNDLYPSPKIVRVIKSRRMRWAGHVACMDEETCIQGFGGETCGKETTWETQA